MRSAQVPAWRFAGPRLPQQKTGRVMRNTAAWEGSDKDPSPPSKSGHLPWKLPQVHSGASVRSALLPIALMSKKNLFSRLALQLLPEDVASCLALQKARLNPWVANEKMFQFWIRSTWFRLAPGHRFPPRGRFAAFLLSGSDSVEGPLDLSPRIQQSDWTSMRAVSWVFRFCQFQQ